MRVCDILNAMTYLSGIIVTFKMLVGLLRQSKDSDVQFLSVTTASSLFADSPHRSPLLLSMHPALPARTLETCDYVDNT